MWKTKIIGNVFLQAYNAIFYKTFKQNTKTRTKDINKCIQKNKNTFISIDYKLFFAGLVIILIFFSWSVHLYMHSFNCDDFYY